MTTTETKYAAPLPSRPGHKPVSVDRAIDKLFALLAETPSDYEMKPDETAGELMMEGLRQELELQDQKRRELWGDKFPHRLGQKPLRPDPSPKPNNRDNSVKGKGKAKQGDKRAVASRGKKSVGSAGKGKLA